jgi:hypothetical protein
MVIRKDKMLLSKMNLKLTKLAAGLTKQQQIRSLKKNALFFATKLESFSQKATPVAKASIKKSYQRTSDLVASKIAISHRREKTEETEPQNKNMLNIKRSYMIERARVTT